jgi:hypothetical protein
VVQQRNRIDELNAFGAGGRGGADEETGDGAGGVLGGVEVDLEEREGVESVGRHLGGEWGEGERRGRCERRRPAKEVSRRDRGSRVAGERTSRLAKSTERDESGFSSFSFLSLDCSSVSRYGGSKDARKGTSIRTRIIHMFTGRRKEGKGEKERWKVWEEEAEVHERVVSVPAVLLSDEEPVRGLIAVLSEWRHEEPRGVRAETVQKKEGRRGRRGTARKGREEG